MFGRGCAGRLRRAVAVLAIAAFGSIGSPASSAPAAAEASPDQPDVTTLAGSGRSGFADGPGPEAEFVAPIGLHYAPDGTLYVADRGAQRIRAVAPNGFVRTVAGSGAMIPLGIGVSGGFADGPAANAKFHDPEDVAVTADGTVIVADTLNYCLRAISHGVVSTFAGRCGEFGNANGPRSVARFGRPRSLAVARNGDIYIVDPPNGIRRIANGVVSNFSTSHATDAVAIATVSDPEPDVVVASSNQIDLVSAASGKTTDELNLLPSYVLGNGRGDQTPTGPASAIAAFSDHEFVYTDPLNSALMLAEIDGPSTYLRLLGAPPPLVAPMLGAHFQEGRATARFDEPTAVALSGDGRLAVADLGNRRIRLVSRFDYTTSVERANRPAELPEAPDPTVYRIALVGSSYVAQEQGRDDSIAGELQAALNAAKRPNQKRVEVYTVVRSGASVLDLISLIANDFGDGGFDAVVLDVPDQGQYPFPPFVRGLDLDPPSAVFPAGWPAKARASLTATRQTLAKAHTAFVVTMHPGVEDFQDEGAYLRVEKGNSPQLTADVRDPSIVQRYHDDVVAAVAGTGIPIVDSWPAMIADHDSSNRESLFFAWDHHFAPHGREIVARQLAKYFASGPTSP